MCGATLTAVCTSVIYNGYGVFKGMINGLEAFWERKGYKSVQDIIGIVTPNIQDLKAFAAFVAQKVVPKDAIKITVDLKKCNGCKKCNACNDNAIRMYRGIAKINLKLCQRYGVCTTICPKGAITISS